MTLHGALSILADISAGMEEPLADLLQQIETDPGNNPLIPFATITSIHFSRFLILPAKPDPEGNPIPCRLLIGEMARLDCSFSFLRRSFTRDTAGHRLPPVVSRIRTALLEASARTAAEVQHDRMEFLGAVYSYSMTEASA